MADGAQIAEIAKENLGKQACSINSTGGRGYYSSCTGAGGAPQLWCADFARWVWMTAGVNVDGLTPAAGSFAEYGRLGGDPQVGDAVVFDYGYEGPGTAQHVAIVVDVDGGNIVTIGGDENGQQDNWAATSQVCRDGPYPAAPGYSSYMEMTISGYVSPKGAQAPPPPPPPPAVRSSRQVAPVVTWGADSLHAFAVAADNSVEYRAWNGRSWDDWVNLGGTVGSAHPMPVPVAWGVNHLDVFYAGADNNVYHKGWGGSSWNREWDNLSNSGEALASPPLAVSQEENSLDIFYMGPHHHTIWRRSWRGSWGGWMSLGEISTAPDSTLAVCTWGAGRLDVCAVGANKTVMHSGWDGRAWGGGWEDIGGNPAYDPALVSWGPQRLDVFIVGTDGSLWHNSWNGSWLGWQDMGNPGDKFDSAPFAVCQAENRIDVFVMGEHRQTIWRRSWNGGSWSGWESLGAIVSSASAKAAAATWAPGRLDAFTEVAPSSVYHSGWDGGPWGGGWANLAGDVKFF
jgi:hypothetical protein